MKKKIHPAISAYYRKLGLVGGRKSAEVRNKKIIEVAERAKKVGDETSDNNPKQELK